MRRLWPTGGCRAKRKREELIETETVCKQDMFQLYIMINDFKLFVNWFTSMIVFVSNRICSVR
jgi:hypothetical protein